MLLFDNVASEARDIAANERSTFDLTWQIAFLTVTAFLSWLKLSVYMSIVAVAIVLNFHLKSKPSTLGKQRQRQQNHSVLTRRRKEVVSSVGYCVLATFISMLIVRSRQLHWDSLKL